MEPTQAAWRAERRAQKEKARQEKLEREADKEAYRLLHGGLTVVGHSRPCFDGYRSYTIEQLRPYTDMRHRWNKSKKLTPEFIAEFYRLWQRASGYLNELGTLRKLIAPIKVGIWTKLLKQAQRKHWEYGTRENVLYIDTPGSGEFSSHR